MPKKILDKTIDILKGMEKKQLKRLPVGIQTFSEVIDLDCLYIDKTEYIWNMIHLSKYIFLSRPRRFGKSLLVSTLQAYFEGRKDLFKGLFIETVEKEWTEYPVLRFSMASGKHMEKDQVERYLGMRLVEYEKKCGITNPATDNNDRFTALIKAAYNTEEIKSSQLRKLLRFYLYIRNIFATFAPDKTHWGCLRE